MDLSGSMPPSCLVSESHCLQGMGRLGSGQLGSVQGQGGSTRRARRASRPVTLGEAELAPAAAHPWASIPERQNPWVSAGQRLHLGRSWATEVTGQIGSLRLKPEGGSEGCAHLTPEAHCFECPEISYFSSMVGRELLGQAMHGDGFAGRLAASQLGDLPPADKSCPDAQWVVRGKRRLPGRQYL